MINKVILTGRLVADPERKETNSGEYARYRIAVPRKYKRDETDFFDCVAFGKSAEFAVKYMQKGGLYSVIGRLQSGSYTKQDGTKVKTVDIIVDEQGFLESKGKAEQAGNTKKDDWESAETFLDLPFE